jgi:hypothetical protein
MNQSPAFQVEIFRDVDRWRLLQEGRAIDVDVRSGEASAVGELMTSNELLISFCPFCGAKL